MGLWFHFRGGVPFTRPVDEEFKNFFNYYSKMLSYSDPMQPYGTPCPWYIDDYNCLACKSTKFGDHKVWLEYIASRFLTPFGLQAHGKLEFIVDPSDPDDEESWLNCETWHINTGEYVKFAHQDILSIEKVLEFGRKYMDDNKARSS